MTVYVRRVTLSAMRNGSIPITQLLSARASFGYTQRVSMCEFVTPRIPPGLTYDDEISLTMGAGNDIVRFRGIVRDFRYSMNPRGVLTVCYGFLRRAVEYENWEDPTVIGGLIPSDLTSGGTTWSNYAPVGYSDNAGNIISAVLSKANVPHNANNIGSSEHQYGLLEDAYVWANGVNPQNFDLVSTGETAMSYIERYDEVDGDHDGRYRTFDSLDGTVFRVKIAFPPNGSPDISPFTETIDILDGQITRSISETRNYFVVTGYDFGANAGPEFFALQTSNTFQGSGTKHTKHLSSPMVERSNDGDDGAGQACETLCHSLAAEFNREITTGWIDTFRDDTIGPGQKHQISGNGGQPDRLGTGQLVIVQGVEVSVDQRGFTQRITYLG